MSTQALFNARMLWVVDQLVTAAVKLDGNPSPEKQGGYLTVICGNNSVMELQSIIGQIVLEKKDKYREFSEEKPTRLMWNPAHVSSHQSRDPENGQWGGAIRAGKYFIGFSGLPELLDEAVVTVAAWHMNLITKNDIRPIVEASSNPFTYPLFNSLLSIPEMPAMPA